mmetsp:Transcript_45279/g.127529  ORF Transcript_45279/g.127529 Transcript_45279/m.127529 type:complete len:110 (+) Transcript_45279:153-482(+)
MICASAPDESEANLSKVPCWTTRPSSESTATFSHRLISDKLWVTTMVVGLPALGASTASTRSEAVATSSAEVGSSSRSTGALRTNARAKDSRCRSPPESMEPPRPTGAV